MDKIDFVYDVLLFVVIITLSFALYCCSASFQAEKVQHTYGIGKQSTSVIKKDTVFSNSDSKE